MKTLILTMLVAIVCLSTAHAQSAVSAGTQRDTSYIQQFRTQLDAVRVDLKDNVSAKLEQANADLQAIQAVNAEIMNCARSGKVYDGAVCQDPAVSECETCNPGEGVE